MLESIFILLIMLVVSVCNLGLINPRSFCHLLWGWFRDIFCWAYCVIYMFWRLEDWIMVFVFYCTVIFSIVYVLSARKLWNAWWFPRSTLSLSKLNLMNSWGFLQNSVSWVVSVTCFSIVVRLQKTEPFDMILSLAGFSCKRMCRWATFILREEKEKEGCANS